MKHLANLWKDLPTNDKKRFEEIDKLQNLVRHKPTMRILDDIDDALDNEDLDEKTRMDLFSVQMDIIDNDSSTRDVEEAAEFWSRVNAAMDRAYDFRDNGKSKRAKELYESMLNTYEGIEQVFKLEYERRDHDQIFGIEPYFDEDPPY